MVRYYKNRPNKAERYGDIVISYHRKYSNGRKKRVVTYFPTKSMAKRQLKTWNIIDSSIINCKKDKLNISKF